MTENVKTPSAVGTDKPVTAVGGGQEESYFNRPPRIQPHMPSGEIEIPGPPEVEEGIGEGPAWARLIPLVMTMLPTLMYAVAMLSWNPDRGTSAVVIVLVRVAGPIVTIILTLVLGQRVLNYAETAQKERTEQKLRETALNYEKRLRQIELNLERQYGDQRSVLYRLNPPLGELEKRLPVIRRGQIIYPDARLWERRPTDEDFLALRIGTGTLPSHVAIKYPNPLDYTLPPAQRDRHLYEAIRIGERYERLRDVPVVVNLREQAAVSIVGEEKNRLGLLRGMLMQLVTHHAPNEVGLYIIAPNDRDQHQRWAWARWLPHCNADLDGSKGIGDLMLRDSNPQIVGEFLERLLKQLNRRRERVDRSKEEDTEETVMVAGQHLVIVLDDYSTEVAQHPVFSSILNNPQELQVSVIFNNGRIQDVPSQCSALIRLDLQETTAFWYAETGVNGERIPSAGWDIKDDNPRIAARPLSLEEIEERSRSRHHEEAPKLPPISPSDPAWWEITEGGGNPTMIDQCEMDAARRFADRLGGVRLRTLGATGDIPNYVGFLDMYGITTLPELNLSHKWFDRSRTDIQKGKFPLGVPIGMRERNKVEYFHLLEGVDGPHGLVAGTTGSGKSEYLQTLVSALAVEHHPYFLSFFLIDYKGGSSFVLFRRLPHTVGVVSNLAPDEAERALIAVKVEVQYRQRVFASIKEEKINDIIKYHRLYVHYLNFHEKSIPPPEGVVLPEYMEPVPHLVIIIDEFAELKQELPHFMPEMSRVARVGRSLGVHLILATQRPAGSVSEEVRANSQSAVCLRVRSVADSRDMIGQSDAMFLPNDVPGRGFLKSGSNPPVLFQSGYVGEAYNPRRAEARYQIEPQTDTGFEVFWTSRANLYEPEFVSRYMPPADSSPTAETGGEVSEQNHDEAESVPIDRGGGTVVERLVEYIADYASDLQKAGRYQPLRQLWQQPLPAEISLDAIFARREHERLNDIIWRGRRNDATEEEREAVEAAEAQRAALIEHPDDEGQGDRDIDAENSMAYMWQWSSRWWDDNPIGMKVPIGLLDDPANRRQEILEINLDDPLKRSHLVVYGAPSTGKTTLLRGIISGLAQFHAPWQLHVHIIDFGVNNALRALRELPHVGTYSTPADEPRLRRLLRYLEGEYQRRRSLNKINGIPLDDVYKHNQRAIAEKRYADLLPIIMIVIDNTREFLDVFGESLPLEAEILQNIAQDGINLGMLLVASAGNSYNEVPSVLTRSIQYRVAFRMNEDDAMQMVVGGRPPYISGEAPAGRAMWRGSPPLQLQVAQFGQGGGPDDLARAAHDLIQQMQRVLKDHPAAQIRDLQPFRIGELERILLPSHDLIMSSVEAIKARPTTQSETFELPLGQAYGDLKACVTPLHELPGHIFVIGRRRTGKTSVLMNIARQASHIYGEQKVKILLFAPSNRSELGTVVNLPGVIESRLFHGLDGLKDVLAILRREFQSRSASQSPNDYRLLTIMDNLDEIVTQDTDNFKRLRDHGEPGTLAQVAVGLEEAWIQKGVEVGMHFAGAYQYQLLRGTLPFGKSTMVILNEWKTLAYVCVTSYQTAELLNVPNLKDFQRKRIDFNVPGRGLIFVEGDPADVIQFTKAD